MKDKIPEKTPLAKVSEIRPNNGLEVVYEGKVYAIFQTAAGYFALDGMCPHAGGPLAQGTLRGEVVTCPWHGWQFNVTTGQHCLNPRVQTSCQQLIIKDGELFFS